MNKEIYKIIPFSEVAIGQEFENARAFSVITPEPRVRQGGGSTCIGRYSYSTWGGDHPCLVRIADCK
jgi:hypothetical protein